MKYSDKKIVILEKNSVTPSGDICLDSVIDLGNAVVYDSVPEGELYDIVKGAEAVICSKAKFTAEVLEKCPDLRYIGLWATGYDNIDVSAACEKGIKVCNVPGYSTDSVAQHTFAMILNLASNSIKYDKSIPFPSFHQDFSGQPLLKRATTAGTSHRWSLFLFFHFLINF